MEREPPEKILQLKAVCTTLPFVLSTRQRAPRGALGDCPPLSMNDECHIHECIITFDFSVWHRVRLVGPGTSRLKLY